MGLLYFNFEEWLEWKKLAIHCKTYEEAANFVKVLKENKWCDKIIDAPSYEKYLTYWDEYKENTCYNFRSGCYGRYDYYKKHNWTILEWSDYMSTTPKAILQEHDIVITRNHEGYMYYANQNIFVNSRGYNLVGDYDEDLIMTPEDDEDDVSEFDIMQILRPEYAFEFVEINWGDAEVVWKRPETVEMTLEEICEALGKNVKIVKSKGE